jgi:P27 family predicted phage terminase small subunit
MQQVGSMVMAKRNGPPPKPTALRVIQGTANRRPSNRREARPEPGIPTCPAHLDAVARAEWKRIAPQLHEADLLTQIDRSALAVYCAAWSDWIAARKALEEHGATFVRRTGAPSLSPYVTIANVAMKTMLNALAEFGMTPASRTRITPATGIEDEDPGERFFRD